MGGTRMLGPRWRCLKFQKPFRIKILNLGHLTHVLEKARGYGSHHQWQLRAGRKVPYAYMTVIDRVGLEIRGPVLQIFTAAKMWKEK